MQKSPPTCQKSPPERSALGGPPAAQGRGEDEPRSTSHGNPLLCGKAPPFMLRRQILQPHPTGRGVDEQVGGGNFFTFMGPGVKKFHCMGLLALAKPPKLIESTRFCEDRPAPNGGGLVLAVGRAFRRWVAGRATPAATTSAQATDTTLGHGWGTIRDQGGDIVGEGRDATPSAREFPPSAQADAPQAPDSDPPRDQGGITPGVQGEDFPNAPNPTGPPEDTPRPQGPRVPGDTRQASGGDGPKAQVADSPRPKTDGSLQAPSPVSPRDQREGTRPAAHGVSTAPRAQDLLATLPRKKQAARSNPPPRVAEENILRRRLLARLRVSQSQQSGPPPFQTRIEQFQSVQRQLDSFFENCQKFLMDLHDRVPQMEPFSHEAQTFQLEVERWAESLGNILKGAQMVGDSGLMPGSKIAPIMEKAIGMQRDLDTASAILQKAHQLQQGAVPPSNQPPRPEVQALVELHKLALLDIVTASTATPSAPRESHAAAPLPSSAYTSRQRQCQERKVPPGVCPMEIFLDTDPWVRDLTQDGDVEANPGPEHSMLVDEHGQVEGNSEGPKSFQEIAPQFSSFIDPYAPRTHQLPNGQWYELRPHPHPCFLTAAEQFHSRAITTFFSGDGLENPRLPPNLEIFDLANQHQLTVASLVGKHSFIFLPRALPFEDTPAVYSLRSWSAALKAALSTPSEVPTLVAIVLQSRFDSPSPTALPVLDRRFELDPLRKFLSAIRIFPEVCLFHRDMSDGSIVLDRLPPPFPLMMFLYSSTSCFCPTITTKVCLEHVVPPSIQLPAEDSAIHVIINANTPPYRGQNQQLTGLRLLMLLNRMGAEETSTNFRNALVLRYPADFVPIIQRASPPEYTIAHYHVPSSILQKLQEDKEELKEVGVEWGVMAEPLEGSLIINHSPRKFNAGGKPSKHPSPEVRDCLLAIPAIARLLECTLLLNKWDVWVRPCPGVAVDLLAAQLGNLDDLVITDATQLNKVRGPKGPISVSPPDVLVSFPARLLPTAALAQVARLVPVLSHQPTNRPGLLRVRVSSSEIASLMYGVILVSCHGTIRMTSGTDQMDTQWERSHGLQRAADWESRLPLLQPLLTAPPTLSAENLLGLQAMSSSPKPDFCAPRPKKVAAIFSRNPPTECSGEAPDTLMAGNDYRGECPPP